MTLKFLQWNVWFKENIDHIVTEIKHSQADIITAQEFILDSRYQTDTAAYLAEQLGFNYFYYSAAIWDNRPEKEAQGNAIFSKFPILNTHHVFLRPAKHNPKNAFEEGRVYLEATLEIGEQELVVGTTHLTFTPQFEITPPRQQEAENLLKIFQTKKSRYIFGADLNALPTSSIVKEIEKLLVHAGPTYQENTFANQPFNYRGIVKIPDLSCRLDYVFATPDIKIKNTQTLTTPYSDHLPILAEIEL
jgi:endonuclease/exonuclease/phosphatase family metal-dependent hydrolase